ncbi:MAG TPA: alpha-amylase family glycosyl hydrolase [Candidatus Angelobacter sp.]|nr:alpha-amylase family glycosyl hydrolase [Candidatus Angelobacter sp.]
MPVFEFHISRKARDRYTIDDVLFSLTGNVVFANLAASRDLAHRINQVRDVERHPERAIHAGALNAMGLIDEALHVVMASYRLQRDPQALSDALEWFRSRLGAEALDRTLLEFVTQFPAVSVYRNQQPAAKWLAGVTGNVPNRAIALEELILLWLANMNPAFRPFQELFDDSELRRDSSYSKVTAALREYFETRPRFGPDNQNLIDLLRAPALASPESLEGQLAFMRDKWPSLIGDLVQKMLSAIDILKEEAISIWMRFHPPVARFGGPVFGDSSAAAIPHFGPGDHEYERFSADQDWMPRAVVLAKSVYVWLDQLSKAYKRHIHRLDQIPDEELDLLARRGFNGLWLIGLWERSRASQRIKQMCGNPEAAASAYSLNDYSIAQDLGGEAACANLRDRAAARGIRLASDMVPNHMGIDSRWVIEHPDWFLSLPYSPFPSYSFNGPDIGGDGRVEIKIEDHYFDRTDAAVVFRRLDRWTGDTRYIYHGNDGTSFPWNDTAQLNYLKPEVREAVIQTILHVARMFPIIRFDAAMTLAKRHYQRLWFPEPGTGGAIPSRAEHGLSKAAFDAAMPVEFWREVVDRVAAEAPNTLLLAEAFWLMEGYFVRTLGMHRVYNSAFMNMLRDEENANYRSVIKNTLSFDPDVLKRYVNFMNNPDERTAVDQFGKGDKYFGVCTLMATLPGLPMFGHGQIEGYTERYGMEYRRAYHDEQPDPWLVARHEREISPLLHRRYLFAEARSFLLYDFFTDSGHVNEDVFAYSNRSGGERGLVVFNNRYASTRGWIRASCAFAEKTEHGRHLRQSTLGESFGFHHASPAFAAFRDALSGLEYIHRARDLAERGLQVELHAYQTHVFLDWRDLHEDAAHPWGRLCDALAGRGVPSLDEALKDLLLQPVHQALRGVLDPALAEALATAGPSGDGFPAALETARSRAAVLLAEVDRYLSETSSIAARDRAVELFGNRLQAAQKLALTYKAAGTLWPLATNGMPALDGENQRPQPGAALHKPSWTAVLGWCALEAIGVMHDPESPDPAAAELFDALRLRGPLAAVFGAEGLNGDEDWRAAARLRASFAHSSRSHWPSAAQRASRFAGSETPFVRPATERTPMPVLPLFHPQSWIHDPDVAWAIGVHEHEGVSYLVKEHLERLMWWMALRDLLEVAAAPEFERDQLALIEGAIRERMRVAERGGYRVEVLEDIVLFGAPQEREPSTHS